MPQHATSIPSNNGKEGVSDQDRKSQEVISIEPGVATPLADYDTEKPKNAYVGSTHQHPFSDPRDAQHWANVYEHAQYEGRHRFDPSYQWDAATEKRLIRKVGSCVSHLAVSR